MAFTLLTPANLPHFEWGKTKVDQATRPVLLTSGCCESCLNYDDNYHPWTVATWPEEFDKRGLSYSWETLSAGSSYPYPLSENEIQWISEDGEGFQDGSCAYWTYATTALYKDRKWLAPFIEYNTTYDGTDDIHDDDEIQRRFEFLNSAAAKHIRMIQSVLSTLPFDTMIQLDLSDPDSPLVNQDYTGYRIFLDMEPAMRHFGSFEAYQAWMRANLGYYVIEELPV